MTVRRGLPVAPLVTLLVALLAACDPTAPEAEVPPPTPGAAQPIDLGDRPFQLHIPESYDPATAVPLVMLLHGFTSNGAEQESYFQLIAESDRHGFLYAMPEGTTDPNQRQFWNATDACCDFTGTGVDDSAYLRDLIDLMVSAYPVDPARVYLVGHSNGGFMAYRMACHHADVVTAVVSLAGMPTDDPSQCQPERPVSVLHIHGTADPVIRYDGGQNAGNPYPSVTATMELWRDRNGCDERPDTSAPPLDLVADPPGPETTVTTYAEGCQAGSRVELWSIEAGGHVPAFTDEFAPSIVEFLYAQRRAEVEDGQVPGLVS